MARYRERPELDGYNSSREIMELIEMLAGDMFTHDDGTAAHKIWASPTDQQVARIVAAAWELTDDDTLHWGQVTYRRAVS